MHKSLAHEFGEECDHTSLGSDCPRTIVPIMDEGRLLNSVEIWVLA